MGKIKTKIKELKMKYRQHIEFNRNVAIATGAGMLGAIGCAELADYLCRDPNLTSVVSTIGDSVVFAGVYLPLHYRMKRGEFAQDGEMQWKDYWLDIGKTYLSSLPALMIFYPLFTVGNNLLLREGARPWISTTASFAGAYVPSMVAMTYIAHKSKLVKQSD